jgi:hypothetical protein
VLIEQRKLISVDHDTTTAQASRHLTGKRLPRQ